MFHSKRIFLFSQSSKQYLVSKFIYKMCNIRFTSAYLKHQQFLWHLLHSPVDELGVGFSGQLRVWRGCQYCLGLSKFSPVLWNFQNPHFQPESILYNHTRPECKQKLLKNILQYVTSTNTTVGNRRLYSLHVWRGIFHNACHPIGSKVNSKWKLHWAATEEANTLGASPGHNTS